MKKNHVVILGGGFAGIEAGIRLREQNKDVIITLLNKDECFSFTPAIYETAAGELTEDNVCILIPSIFKDHNIRYFSDEAKSVDLEKNVITTVNKLSIPYDYLIIALGAETNWYSLPGLAQHLTALKTKDEAQKIYAHVTNAITHSKTYDFVVCGGGLTGVEFASTLADHIIEETGKKHLSESGFTVTLVHSRKHVLHTLPDKVCSYATEYLEKQGITLKLETRIEKATEKYLHTTTGKIGYDLGVWCGGLKTHDFIIKNKLPYKAKEMGRGVAGGGMLVNQYLQLISNEYVFGVGDCIDVKEVSPPKTAQNAIHQAHVCADNVNALLQGKKAVAYEPINNKFYIAMGKHMGICVDGDNIAVGKEQKEIKDMLEQQYVHRKRGMFDIHAKKYIYV